VILVSFVFYVLRIQTDGWWVGWLQWVVGCVISLVVSVVVSGTQIVVVSLFFLYTNILHMRGEEESDVYD